MIARESISLCIFVRYWLSRIQPLSAVQKNLWPLSGIFISVKTCRVTVSSKNRHNRAVRFKTRGIVGRVQYLVITAHWPGGIVFVWGTCTVFFSLFKGWWQAEKINWNQIKHSWAQRGSAVCDLSFDRRLFLGRLSLVSNKYPPTSHNIQKTSIVIIIIIYGRLLRYGLPRSENRISRKTGTLDINYNANANALYYIDIS